MIATIIGIATGKYELEFFALNALSPAFVSVSLSKFLF